jgi:hypothetical protein
MPLYAVRWPDLHVSIVKAQDERELIELLNEEDDPASCRYAVYDGPLWVNLDMPVRVSWDRRPAPGVRGMVVKDLERLAPEGIVQYKLDFGGGVTAFEMRRAVTGYAFPHIQRVLDEYEAGEENDPSVTDLEVAVRRELEELSKHLWRSEHVQRSSDPKAKVLALLGLPEAPPWLEGVWVEPEPDDPES